MIVGSDCRWQARKTALIVAGERQSGRWRSRRIGGGRLLVGLCLAGDGRAPAVAFDVHLEDGGMVDEAVDGGDGHRGIGEHLAPLTERLVGGDHQRAVLVASGDEFEQYAGLGLILADIREVIEDQQVEAVEFGDGRGECSACRSAWRRCTMSVVRMNNTR